MFADVLDAMGKSPREFVGVHVHFEAVQLVDGRRFVFSLLLQSAFNPVPSKVEVVISCLSSRRVVVRFPLPSLEDGRVVRVRVPGRIEVNENPEFGVHLEGPPPKGRRVRTAWKLTEGVEWQLEPALRGPQVDGTTRPLDEMLLELLWRPGQRVPEAAPPIAIPPSKPKPVRWCRVCGFEGLRDDYEHLRQCPQCDEPWL